MTSSDGHPNVAETFQKRRKLYLIARAMTLPLAYLFYLGVDHAATAHLGVPGSDLAAISIPVAIGIVVLGQSALSRFLYVCPACSESLSSSWTTVDYKDEWSDLGRGARGCGAILTVLELESLFNCPQACPHCGADYGTRSAEADDEL